jgi:hypothetical protein
MSVRNSSPVEPHLTRGPASLSVPFNLEASLHRSFSKGLSRLGSVVYAIDRFIIPLSKEFVFLLILEFPI